MRSVPATSEAVFVCSLAKLVVVADQEVFVVGLITTAASQFVRPFVATVQTTSFLYCQSLLRQEFRTLQATQHVLATSKLVSKVQHSRPQNCLIPLAVFGKVRWF